MLIGEGDGRMMVLGHGFEDGPRLRLRLPYHHRHPLFDDAGLLAGYLLQRVAQELRVVEPYVGDDGKLGHYHIGRVQPASHAHLYYSHIHLFTCKVVEGEPHGHLEEGEFE